MAKKIDLIRTYDSVKQHNLSVLLEEDRLLFDEGDYYGPTDAGGYHDSGREYDEYLIVQPVNKTEVLQRLFEDLPADLRSSKEPDLDTQIVQALQNLAQLKKWGSLDTIEKWLTDKKITFTKHTWFWIE